MLIKVNIIYDNMIQNSYLYNFIFEFKYLNNSKLKGKIYLYLFQWNKNYLFNITLQLNIYLMEIGNRDLDKLDPDWRFAYFHAKSTKPGICT